MTVIAWAIIVLVMIAGAVAQWYASSVEDPGPNPDDPIGEIMLEIQGKSVLGALGETPSSTNEMYDALAPTLNTGSVTQRQQFVIFAAEIADAETAAEVLDELEDDLEEARTQAAGNSETFQLTEEQQAVQDVLHLLYGNESSGGDDDGESRIARLSNGQKDVLRNELGWYGRLATAEEGSPKRNEMLGSAKLGTGIFVGGLFVLGGLGFLGFIGLIVLIALFISRESRKTGLGVGRIPHGIYAETFAIWLLLFYGLQLIAGIVGAMMPENAMVFVILAFFSSLAVLGWPVIRGWAWGEIRRDIGWTFGRTPPLEPIIGLGGYFMALPLLAIGVLLTLLLIQIQGVLDGMFGDPETNIFSPIGGPAHPIITEVAQGGWAVRIQILLVASVAAPIVEETMFRGVLYRHLRDWSSRWGVILSILLSGTISSFVFAFIHPQGWVAIPALMGLAYGFVIVREWRGTLLPSMVIHGVSNGLVMSLLMMTLSSG